MDSLPSGRTLAGDVRQGVEEVHVLEHLPGVVVHEVVQDRLLREQVARVLHHLASAAGGPGTFKFHGHFLRWMESTPISMKINLVN